MKNYTGLYITQNKEEVPLQVSFANNYNYDDEFVKLEVQNFTVTLGEYSYEIMPLIKGDEISENLLKNTLSVDNPEVALYADGAHHHHEKVQKKIDLWGTRVGAMKCFIPQDNNESGYFNTGTSLVKTQFHGIPLESGILKSSAGDIDVIKTTGIAVRCFMYDVYNETKNLPAENSVLTSNHGIYTVRPDNQTTISILEGCGYKISINNTGLQKDLISSSERFKYEDGKLLEGQNNVEKLLYSCDYAELPEGMNLVGDVQEGGIE